MISSKNPWHSILLRKKDYQKSNMSKQKESKRSKKLFVDLLEDLVEGKAFATRGFPCYNELDPMHTMNMDKLLAVGTRVVRGPDWKWGDQDGGEGHAGTVVEIGGSSKKEENKERQPPSPRGTVILQWDTGVRTNYRVGHQNSYDLRTLDSAPASISHSNIVCKICHNSNNINANKAKRRASSTTASDSSSGRNEESKGPNKCDKTSSSLFISGIRWSCSVCSLTVRNSYDLCTACYMSDKHDVSHPFWRIETSSSIPTEVDPSSPFHVPEGALLMPVRSGAKRITLKGLFPNCKVVRGQDWNWSDQDGGPGKVGKILEIHGWDSESERSVATVHWISSNIQNVYRLGHKGKVDLKVAPGTSAATCGSYYPDHLPILGKANVLALNRGRNISLQNSCSTVDNFNVGDMVKINVGVEQLRSLQEGHSGFNPRMSSIIGKIGKVHRVTGNGDVRVQYNVPPNASENPANYRWTVNPAGLTKIDPKDLNKEQTKLQMEVGSIVKVLEIEELVRSLQVGHGEWIPRMKSVLGKTGRVLKVYADGDVRVEMTENNGLEGGNTLTFNPACLNIQPIHSNNNALESEGGQRQQPMISSKNNSCGSPFPALAEVQVDSIVADAAHGNLNSLQQRFAPSDLNFDINVARACLQAAAQHGRTEVVKFLVDKFPNEVNTKHQGKTPLHVASHQGHLDVVRFLIKEANASVHTIDDDGDSALHYAAFGRQVEVMKFLLHPALNANINTVNMKQCSVLHVSVVMQDISAVALILEQLNIEVNVQDAYGDTPLHEAIVKECSDITEMICSLATKSRDNIDSIPLSIPDFSIKNKRGFNALHYAALKGNLAATKSILRNASNTSDNESNKLIDLKKDDGYTALHLACLNGHKNVASYLIENNADLEAADNRGQTVLHSAVHQGQAAIVELLLTKSENHTIINKEDMEGETPLHLALSREGSPPIEATKESSPAIFDLMEKARLKGVNATQIHAVSIAAYLVGQGANPAAKNKVGNTPSDIVTDYNARTFILGFTSTRPAEEAIASRKINKNNASTIKDNLASTIKDDVKPKKDPCLPTVSGNNEEQLIIECSICSEMVAPIEFQPCGCKIVCSDCGQRMKKCIVCKQTIESKVLSSTCPETTTKPSTKRQRPPSASAEGRNKDRDIEKRLQDYEEQHVCTICMERPKTVAFTCGHRTCVVCVETLRSCHMCRVPITQKINLY